MAGNGGGTGDQTKSYRGSISQLRRKLKAAEIENRENRAIMQRMSEVLMRLQRQDDQSSLPTSDQAAPTTRAESSGSSNTGLQQEAIPQGDRRSVTGPDPRPHPAPPAQHRSREGLSSPRRAGSPAATLRRNNTVSLLFDLLESWDRLHEGNLSTQELHTLIDPDRNNANAVTVLGVGLPDEIVRKSQVEGLLNLELRQLTEVVAEQSTDDSGSAGDGAPVDVPSGPLPSGGAAGVGAPVVVPSIGLRENNLPGDNLVRLAPPNGPRSGPGQAPSADTGSTSARSEDPLDSVIAHLLEEELRCSVCKELFLEATSISCGHSFCQQCWRRWSSISSYCPICRRPSHASCRNLILDSVVNVILEKKQDSSNETIRQIIRERANIRQNRASYH